MEVSNNDLMWSIDGYLSKVGWAPPGLFWSLCLNEPEKAQQMYFQYEQRLPPTFTLAYKTQARSYLRNLFRYIANLAETPVRPKRRIEADIDTSTFDSTISSPSGPDPDFTIVAAGIPGPQGPQGPLGPGLVPLYDVTTNPIGTYDFNNLPGGVYELRLENIVRGGGDGNIHMNFSIDNGSTFFNSFSSQIRFPVTWDDANLTIDTSTVLMLLSPSTIPNGSTINALITIFNRPNSIALNGMGSLVEFNTTEPKMLLYNGYRVTTAIQFNAFRIQASGSGGTFSGRVYLMQIA
jgi:hypothetical protein